MLVMVFLQLMEKTSFVVTRIDVVQRVVCQIVTNVPQTEGNPEEGEDDVILNRNDFNCEREQKKEFNADENGRMN